MKNRAAFYGICRLLGLAASLFCGQAQAYSNFIGYGYASCMTCHFNPYGNGPLTDYGRGLYATAIADRPLWAGKDVTEEDLSDQSGFAGSSKLPYWVRPSIMGRDLILASDANHHIVVSNILMQADANVVLKSEDSRYLASLTVGIQDSPPYSNLSPVISREHYLGARVTDSLGLYAGLMDVAYGLRIPDHPAFSRRHTQLAQDDQVHGLLAHYYHENFELGAHAFVGNLLQAPAGVRPKGLSVTGEYEAWSKGRLGMSLLYSQSDYRQRTLGEVHVRSELSHGSSIIGELGVISQNLKEVSRYSAADYLFTQFMWRFKRGLHGLLTAEAYDSDLRHSANREFRLSPGLQWFPFQRLELRTDIVCDWYVPVASSNVFSIGWMAQAHVSL